MASGNPDNGQGSNIDFYLNVEDGFVYSKAGGSWSLSGSIRGPTGATGVTGASGASGATGATGISGQPGSKWYMASGDPAAEQGTVFDFYLDVQKGTVFAKDNGLWRPSGSLSGIQGSKWYMASGAPDASQGTITDFYLDVEQGTVYAKDNGTWRPSGSISGRSGESGTSGMSGLRGSRWYMASGNPDAEQGTVFDFYLDVQQGTVWAKDNGTWRPSGSISGRSGESGTSGMSGLRGSRWYMASGNPDANQGTVFDFYLNVQEGVVWAKDNETWRPSGSISGLSGQRGTKIYTYSGSQDDSIGSNGDMFLDLFSGNFFVKQGSSWTLSGSLRGPTGASGASGASGSALSGTQLNSGKFNLGIATVYAPFSTVEYSGSYFIAPSGANYAGSINTGGGHPWIFNTGTWGYSGSGGTWNLLSRGVHPNFKLNPLQFIPRAGSTIYGGLGGSILESNYGNNYNNIPADGPYIFDVDIYGQAGQSIGLSVGESGITGHGGIDRRLRLLLGEGLTQGTARGSNTYDVKLDISNGLQFIGNQVSVNAGGGLVLGGAGAVEVNAGAGLSTGIGSGLFIDVGPGMTFTGNKITLYPGGGIRIRDNSLPWPTYGISIILGTGIIFGTFSGDAFNQSGYSGYLNIPLGSGLMWFNEKINAQLSGASGVSFVNPILSGHVLSFNGSVWTNASGVSSPSSSAISGSTDFQWVSGNRIIVTGNYLSSKSGTSGCYLAYDSNIGKWTNRKLGMLQLDQTGDWSFSNITGIPWSNNTYIDSEFYTHVAKPITGSSLNDARVVGAIGTETIQVKVPGIYHIEFHCAYNNSGNSASTAHFSILTGDTQESGNVYVAMANAYASAPLVITRQSASISTYIEMFSGQWIKMNARRLTGGTGQTLAGMKFLMTYFR
jgi:hypothetical protein